MSLDSARQHAEEWCRQVAMLPIRYADSTIKLTLSAGVAVFPGHADDLHRLQLRVDEALYRSKNEGRNRVTCFGREQGA